MFVSRVHGCRAPAVFFFVCSTPSFTADTEVPLMSTNSLSLRHDVRGQGLMLTTPQQVCSHCPKACCPFSSLQPRFHCPSLSVCIITPLACILLSATSKQRSCAPGPPLPHITSPRLSRHHPRLSGGFLCSSSGARPANCQTGNWPITTGSGVLEVCVLSSPLRGAFGAHSWLLVCSVCVAVPVCQL